jgi:hypothetical protein
MPFHPPRKLTQQDMYYRRLRNYNATRRVAPPAGVATSSPETAAPSALAAPSDPAAHLRGLAELHESGVLTDDEFAAAKARVLASGEVPT